MQKEAVLLVEEAPQLRFRVMSLEGPAVGITQIVEREKAPDGQVVGERLWIQMHGERSDDVAGHPRLRVFREPVAKSALESEETPLFDEVPDVLELHNRDMNVAIAKDKREKGVEMDPAERALSEEDPKITVS